MNCATCLEPVGKFSMSGPSHNGTTFFCHWNGIIMRVWRDDKLMFEKAWCYKHFPDELSFFSNYKSVEQEEKYREVK